MDKKDYRAEVNSTYYTAQQTMLLLAHAGNADAQRFIGLMGLNSAMQESLEKQMSESDKISEENMRNLMLSAALNIEARYTAVSHILKTGGYSNLLDIACGYTPRSLMCKRLDIDYVGLDVPVVAEQMSKLASQLLTDAKHPVYVGGDATNAASLASAADLMDGELMITSEGLLVYLSKDELAQMIGGIRRILLKHGGAWFSSDMEAAYDKIGAVAVDDPDVFSKLAEIRDNVMDDSTVFYDNASYGSLEEKMQIFKDNGLIVERLPYYYDDETLMMLSQIPSDKKQRMIKILQDCTVWRMTPDPDYRVKDSASGAEEVVNLQLSWNVDGDMFMCRVRGRIDTISAPALLEAFEKVSSQAAVGSVMLNAENLEYISSAGLRVLLNFAKKLGNDSVRVKGASDNVKEIFMTTGFDQVIKVE